MLIHTDLMTMQSKRSNQQAEEAIQKAIQNNSQTLDLSSMGLIELPESLGQLNQLTALNLRNNELISLPEFFKNLSQLTELNLNRNIIKSLPEFIGQFQNLVQLNLESNLLETLPESFGQLKQLTHLEIDFNRLISLPESFWNLKQLKKLSLKNARSVITSEGLKKLSQLTYLCLNRNALNQLPKSIGNLKQLKTLDLSENHLTSLPESFGNLKKLKNLELGNSQLRSLPESFGNLKQLKSLYLGSNQLTSLPESFGTLKQLMELNLANNELTSLPKSFGDLKQLIELNLANNELTSLPKSFGDLKQLKELNLGNNGLTSLPESLGNLEQLEKLYLRDNQLTLLPESIGSITRLNNLKLTNNLLTSLPESIGNLKKLDTLNLEGNQLTSLPESIGELEQLTELDLEANELTSLPESLGTLEQLRELDLANNNLTSLPISIAQLGNLSSLRVIGNQLGPEIEAALNDGTETFLEYLNADTQEEQVILNEAKLILIGEGGVGKTSLLSAIVGAPWVENRDTTHGVEIRQFTEEESASGTSISFNGWDFGGQPLYRHTHQVFFTAPAIYLAVWDPRRGPEVCCIDDWIKMVKHRAYDEKKSSEERPRILIVATHGGPNERIEHIDDQALIEQFGSLISGFHHINSKPDDETSECFGLTNLINEIVRLAVEIPTVGRQVPASWKRILEAIRVKSFETPQITWQEYVTLCEEKGISFELAQTYALVLNELGYFIHFAQDSLLKEFIILRPDWLSKAISFILEDEQIEEAQGLLNTSRLSDILFNPARIEEERYPAELYPIFIKLMEKFDLCYRVNIPNEEVDNTYLIAQLVPNKRPDGWESKWNLQQGDVEKTQICRLVDVETGKPTIEERLMYRLIVRLHRFSLGRMNFNDSCHWKKGILLDDGFNGRALIQETNGDYKVTVRAAYPDTLMHIVCEEIRWLVNSFYKGIDCITCVPCTDSCKGVFSLRALIEHKKEDISKIMCSVCGNFYEIDPLIISVNRSPGIQDVLTEIKRGQREISEALLNGFQSMDTKLRHGLSQIDEQFKVLLAVLNDPAKEGPRLFSLEPVNPKFWDKPKWISQKFRLTLWCEHARLPVSLIENNNRGVYELELTQDWIIKVAPLLKVIATTLQLTLPVVAPTIKMMTEDTAYKDFEKQLEFGIKLSDSAIKSSEHVVDWLNTGNQIKTEQSYHFIKAQGALLRILHGILKQVDPNGEFGGLVRVQNKRHEFLWVHPKNEHEYL